MLAGMIRAARRAVPRAGYAAVLAAATLTASGASAQDRDRHAGYYYPPPTVSETFQAEATTLGEATRVRRIGFITIIVNKSLTASYPPPYAMFVKGAEAEKLIII
ncbi:MAG TPA: hypothetical protein VIF14_03110, partial [Alphaproteobacteria bacterium]